MNKDKEYLGIDVSSKDFDVLYANGDHKCFKNSLVGFRSFVKSLSPNAHCIMEQRGPYHQPLAHHLFTKRVDVSVVNALTIKRFIQMRLKTTKTDKADAKMIREYGEFNHPDLWCPPKKYIVESKEIRCLVSLLLKQSTALKNQRHSMLRSGVTSRVALSVITNKLESIKTEVKQLEEELAKLIRLHDGDLLSRLCSISGIGVKTAMALVIYTNGFRDFEHSKQLSRFIGLSPTIRTSGTSIRGRSRICKTGNRDLRNLLFMCSFSACKHNKACADLFGRITSKGKSEKLALIAVCNKLLKQALAIAKSGLIYDENYRSENPVLK